jgi:hypothetical protein
MEFHFPRLHWTLPCTDDGGCAEPPLAVDVGASPGGWTQYLHAKGYRVIGLDSGELHPSVLCLPHVRWVPHLLGSNDASDVLAAEMAAAPRGRVLMGVCDVNVNPVESARLLTDGIVPLMLGGSASSTSTSTSTSTGEGGAVDMTCVCAPTVAYMVFTLKLLKNPKPHHVTYFEKQSISIFTDACTRWAQQRGGVCETLGASACAGAGASAGAGAGFPDACIPPSRTPASAPSTAPTLVRVVYETVHLCANSKNERTLLIRMESW